MRARAQPAFEARVENYPSIRLRATALLLRIVSTTNVQLVHLVLECCSLQSQALCRSALAGDSPGGGYQSINNGVPLGLFETWRGGSNGADRWFLQLRT